MSLRRHVAARVAADADPQPSLDKLSSARMTLGAPESQLLCFSPKSHSVLALHRLSNQYKVHNVPRPAERFR